MRVKIQFYSVYDKLHFLIDLLKFRFENILVNQGIIIIGHTHNFIHL